MTQSQQPDPLEPRVNRLEGDARELRIAAEALLQTAQIHQRDLQALYRRQEELDQREAELRERQTESDQRFEILLAEFRQYNIESDAKFNAMQAEIRLLINRLFNIPSDETE